MEPLKIFESYAAKAEIIDEYEEMETLFGIKVRVKRGFFQDHEVQLLQGINRCLKAFGYEKVLQVPSNFQILSGLRNFLKESYYSHKEEEKEQIFRNEKVLTQQIQTELKVRAVFNNEKKPEIKNNQTSSQKSIKEQTNQNPQKKEKKRNEQQGQQVNQEKKSEPNLKNQSQQQIQQQQQQKGQQEQSKGQQKQKNQKQQQQQNQQQSQQQWVRSEKQNINIKSEAPLSSKPSEPVQQSLFDSAKLSNLVASLSSKQYSRLTGWFFVDLSSEISSVHSLQTSTEITGRKFWIILKNIWDQIVKNKSTLYTMEDFQLTQAATNIEQHDLRIENVQHRKCNFWMSESQYCLSSTPSGTICFETIQSQKSKYQPFDLRIIFSDAQNNLNCFSALIFGLLYNILAFNLPFDHIFEILTANEVGFTVKLVLYHIFCMKRKNKMTNKELAVNLSLLFRFTKFRALLQTFFMKSFRMNADFTDQFKTIQDFSVKSSHRVIWQNVSPIRSSVHTTEIGFFNSIIFIDVTPNGCALNLFYQDQKINSCMQAYQKQLGDKFILPSA